MYPSSEISSLISSSEIFDRFLDWVAATRGPNPPPGSEPIEVVNMSMSAIRPQRDPESCQGRPAREPDPIHLAVCSVYEAGVTIVVAEGNSQSDAER